MADSVAGIIQELEGLGGEEEVHRVIYGDNMAAITILSTPDGPWRTRHLRLRSNVLRERLNNPEVWSVRHLPGSALPADYLTKAISPRSRWSQFFRFLKMMEPEVEEQIEEVRSQPEGEGLKKSVIAAGLGIVGLGLWKPVPGSALEKVKLAAMGALAAFVAVKTATMDRGRGIEVKEKPKIQAMRMIPLGAVQAVDPGRVRRSNGAVVIRTRWSDQRLDGYFDSRDEDGGDYWEFFPLRGMLRRHHVTPRLELFGHSAASEAVWEVADVQRDHLLPRRRTTILKMDEQGSVFHVHDYWTHFMPEDQYRPTVCDDLWVGFTDFALPGREPLEFMPPFDPSSGLSNPPTDDEEDDGPEEAGVSSTASPDSQEIDAPEEVEDDGQRGTWLTCGSTMLGCTTEIPEESEEEEPEVESGRPQLKMFRFTFGEPVAGDVVGSGDGRGPGRFPGERQEGLEDQSQRVHPTWTGQVELRSRRRNNVRVFTEMASPNWVRRYRADRGEGSDYWDLDGNLGRLRRHHIVRRQELFGHDPWDPNWATCPVARRDLSSWRRTTLLFTNGDVVYFVDQWNFREPLDQIRPSLCDQGWTGFTDFSLRDGEDVSAPAPLRDDDFPEEGQEEGEEEEEDGDPVVPHEPEGEPEGPDDPSKAVYDRPRGSNPNKRSASCMRGEDQSGGDASGGAASSSRGTSMRSSAARTEAAGVETEVEQGYSSTSTVIRRACEGTLTPTLARAMGLGIAAGLPGPADAQPSEEPDLDGELWTFGSVVMFLYTMVVVFVTLLVWWCMTRPSTSSRPVQTPEDRVEDRLWGRPDDVDVPGGVWDGVSGADYGEEDDSDSWISGEFAFSNRANWDIQEDETVNIWRGDREFPPPFGRGARHQNDRVFRPGQGRVRGRTPEELYRFQRRREEDVARSSSWQPRHSTPRPKTERRRRSSSSSTVGTSQSEVSGSFDGEGSFRLRVTTRGPALGKRRSSPTREGPEEGGGAGGEEGAAASLQPSEEASGEVQGEVRIGEEMPQENEMLSGTAATNLSEGGRNGEEPPTLESGPITPMTPTVAQIEVYHTEFGVVYHKRRDCYRLRQARRIMVCPNCAVCAPRQLNGERIFLDRMVYHLDASICNSSVLNVLRPCAVCGR